jgi:hypothetical protein
MSKPRDYERCAQHRLEAILTVEDQPLCYACIVCLLYADTDTKQLAEWLGRPHKAVMLRAHLFGVHKSEAYLATHSRGFFKAGHIPFNKGLRMPGYCVGRMAETQFKKGQRSGFAGKNWKPLGTIVADPQGFLRIKIRERINGKPVGRDKSIWPLVHWREWEKHYGPIPPGHKVVFKDGNRAHCAIDNLELVTDAEMMRRNSINKLPDELTEVIRLNASLKRRLRKIHEEQNVRFKKPSL